MADDILRDVPSQYPATGVRLADRFNLEKVSWGAIWAGTMVTIGMEALFLSFGVFIDAAIGGSTPWDIVWYLVTMAISFFTGAFCAARLSDVSDREISALHGLTTWGLATLATMLMLGVVLLAGLRIGTVLVVTGKAAAPTPINFWGSVEQYSGVIWGGVVLSLFTSFIGGGKGLPNRRTSAQVPTAPMRRAS